MTKEQYKRAMEIQKEILDIRNNKEEVELLRREGNMALYFKDLKGGVAKRALDNVLLVPVENFIDMYLANADKKIIELDKEFENL